MSTRKEREVGFRLEFKNGATVELQLPRVRLKQLARNPAAFRWKVREREEIARQMQRTGSHRSQDADRRKRVADIFRSRPRREDRPWLGWLSAALRDLLRVPFRRMRRRVGRPPGSLFLRLSEYLVSPKTRERIVVPVIGDMRDEYYQALMAKRPVLAFVVRVRGSLSLVVALVTKAAIHALIKWIAPLANVKG